MATNYSVTSPYYETTTYGYFLDVWTPRPIPYLASDVAYQIDAIYHHRPDLMANDLYGDPTLWWVFSMRNPNTIQDPVFDFTAGTVIYVPALVTLNTYLGV